MIATQLTFLPEPRITSPRECAVAQAQSYLLLADLIARWHSTLPVAPVVFTVGFVAVAPDHQYVAAAMWNHPTARHEDQETTLELQRQAHSPFVPRNFGSWFLARQREWIRANMPHIRRLISYQDADVHDGTIYRADNWYVTDSSDRLTPWTHRPGRTVAAVTNRVKWERTP